MPEIKKNLVRKNYGGVVTFPFLFWNVCENLNVYVSLRLRVQNAVPAQPCVAKIRISLVLFNFLHCNFRLWFETP